MCVCQPHPPANARPAAVCALLLQVAGARAERDTMADQAAALARTTHQLMAGGGTAAGAQDGSMSPGGVGSLGGGPVSTPLSAPVSLEKGGSGVASLQLRQRAASEPQASAADAAGEQGQLVTQCWACNVGTHRLAVCKVTACTDTQPP